MTKYRRYRQRQFTHTHSLIATAWWITGSQFLLNMHIKRLYKYFGDEHR